MKLRLGYVPLTDAAPLIVAAELGFASSEGLRLELSREGSWSTLRDKLALGHLDGAHILAPLALAMRSGASGVPAEIVAPLVLSLNGNALTVSRPLWDAVVDEGGTDGAVDATARALVSVVRRRHREGRSVRLATVFPHSTHTILLRLVLEQGGLARRGPGLPPELSLVVLPPSEMAQALGSGLIDGFCVGSPWSSVAVAAGAGRIAAFGVEIAADMPEKVLAVPAGRPDESPALVRALWQAALWCANPANHPDLARLLGSPRHLALDPQLILGCLGGDLVVTSEGALRRHPRFLVLDEGRPTASQERRLRDELAAAGLSVGDGPTVFRPDLFDAATAGPDRAAGTRQPV